MFSPPDGGAAEKKIINVNGSIILPDMHCFI
jgi:hypothetical protein